MKKLLIPVLLLLLLLAGCKAQLSPMEELTVPRAEISGVALQVEPDSLVGSTEATADPEEQTALLDALFSLDLDRFEDAERTGTVGPPYPVVLRTAEYDWIIRLNATGDSPDRIQLRITRTRGETLVDRALNLETVCIKQGPAEAFDIKAFGDLHTAIALSTEDPDNCALVEQVGQERRYQNKRMTAVARTYLDHSLGKDPAPPDAVYDVTVTIGKTVYRIDTATLAICREQEGQTAYGVLGSGSDTVIRVNLGLARN